MICPRLNDLVSLEFSSVSSYAQINHFSFCQRNIYSSWKQMS